MVSPTQGKRSTIKDVARLAGVSPAAVTVALSKRKCTAAVSEETRQRITEIAKLLDYRPNLLAKGLLARRSYLLAFLCREDYAPWMWVSISGIQEVVQPRGYSLICYSHSNSAQAELACLRMSIDRQVEGAILLPMLEANGDHNANALLDLHQKGFPIIQLSHSLDPALPSVTIDNAAAGRQAAEHFHRLGHRRIALYVHELYKDPRVPPPNPYTKQWYAGYRQAMEAFGLEPIVILQPDQPFTFFNRDRAWFDAIIRHPARPTAVIGMHIHIAEAMVRAALNRGLRVPDDLSICGTGPSETVDPPPLSPTTFHHPNTGRHAAELFFNWVDGREMASVVLPPELVLGQTSGPPRKDG